MNIAYHCSGNFTIYAKWDISRTACSWNAMCIVHNIHKKKANLCFCNLLILYPAMSAVHTETYLQPLDGFMWHLVQTFTVLWGTVVHQLAPSSLLGLFCVEFACSLCLHGFPPTVQKHVDWVSSHVSPVIFWQSVHSNGFIVPRWWSLIILVTLWLCL